MLLATRRRPSETGQSKGSPLRCKRNASYKIYKMYKHPLTCFRHVMAECIARACRILQRYGDRQIIPLVSATNGYANQSSKESLQGAQKNCFMGALAYPAVEEFTADLEKRKTNVLHPAVAKTWTGLPPLMTVWTHPRSENAAIQNLKTVKTKSNVTQ